MEKRDSRMAEVRCKSDIVIIMSSKAGMTMMVPGPTGICGDGS